MKPIRFVPLLLLFAAACKEAPPAQKGAIAPPLVTFSRPFADKVSDFTDITGTLESPDVVKLRPRVSGYIDDVKFKDGQEVKPGDVLFTIDPVTYAAEVERYAAQIKIAEAKLDLADKEEKRNKTLVKVKAISAEEYDVYASKLAVAKAELVSAQAAIKSADQNLAWTKVVSPIAGNVDRAYVTKGNVATGGLTEGTVLTTIVSTDPMYAYFDVDDQTVLYFQKLYGKERNPSGKEPVPAEIQLQGEKGYPHKGFINFASNRINPGTGSLQIRGTFPNPNELLIPGRFVRARLMHGKPTDALLLPDSAIQSDQGQKLVFVVTADNKVEARPVKTGPLSQGLRVIVEGVKPDDRVIIKGMQRVRPGMPVEPEEGKIVPAKEADSK